MNTSVPLAEALQRADAIIASAHALWTPSPPHQFPANRSHSGFSQNPVASPRAQPPPTAATPLPRAVLVSSGTQAVARMTSRGADATVATASVRVGTDVDFAPPRALDVVAYPKQTTASSATQTIEEHPTAAVCVASGSNSMSTQTVAHPCRSVQCETVQHRDVSCATDESNAMDSVHLAAVATFLTTLATEVNSMERHIELRMRTLQARLDHVSVAAARASVVTQRERSVAEHKLRGCITEWGNDTARLAAEVEQWRRRAEMAAANVAAWRLECAELLATHDAAVQAHSEERTEWQRKMELLEAALARRNEAEKLGETNAAALALSSPAPRREPLALGVPSQLKTPATGSRVKWANANEVATVPRPHGHHTNDGDDCEPLDPAVAAELLHRCTKLLMSDADDDFMTQA